MVLRAGLVAVLAFSAGVASAEGLTSSRKPSPRPVATLAVAEPVMQATVATSNGSLAPRFIVHPPKRSEMAAAVEAVAAAPMLRPRPRPAGMAVAQVQTAQAELSPEAIEGVEDVSFASPLPRARPQGLMNAVARNQPAKSQGWGIFKAAAVRSKPGKELVMPKKGSVCGVSAIRGEAIAPVSGKIKACGIAEPVKVTAISGVGLSQAITVDCPTAIALNDWVSNGVQKEFGADAIKQLLIAGSYTCRPRNNVRGAKISEHGHGRAVDVAGFVMSDGSKITVARDFRKVKAMKASYKAACGTFGTTLGPGSDGYHEDHMHFDTARYRSGSYCR